MPNLDGLTPPRLIPFGREVDLQDYLDGLNDHGENPTLACIAANGVQFLAALTAPGGDGHAFEYYMPGEDGFMHCCGCCECGPDCAVENQDWTPIFPVFAFAPGASS